MASENARPRSEMANRLPTLIKRLLEARGEVLLGWAAIMAGAIALADRLIEQNISIGLLYIIPILVAAPAVRAWQILAAAAVCALLRENYSPFRWDPGATVRLLYTWISFAGAGLFSSELARNHRLILRHNKEMQESFAAREEAERQLRSLVDSSPAAIITLDASGQIDLANQAAHELLEVPAGTLRERRIAEFLPVIANLHTGHESHVPYRAAANCRGRKASGESFAACVWFATYPTREGVRMAAIITDASEDLRDWQETSLQNLLRSTRVLVGSVSHEIRNVCAAIAMVHANLGRLPGVAATEDYAALGTLAEALSRLATVDLQSSVEAEEPGAANLEQLVEEMRIVLKPTLESEDTTLAVCLDPDLPPVAGDQHGLLQVLLNLARNSLRAMKGQEQKELSVSAARIDGGTILMRFGDSGPGVGDPGRLFQPFQQGADAVGLGLFVSRAIVRANGGELYYEPSAKGCTMCLRLKALSASEPAGESAPAEAHA